MGVCVGVIFDENNGKPYIYKVPKYIKKIKVGDYVVVDTRHLTFSKLNCTMAKVVDVFEETDHRAKIATAYIVDKVKFKPYLKTLKVECKKKEAEKNLQDFKEMVLDQYEEKLRASTFNHVLEVVDDSGELTRQYEELVKEVR